MGYVTGTDSRQMALGVWSIEDEVPQDSPARFIPLLFVCNHGIIPGARIDLRVLELRFRSIWKHAVTLRYDTQSAPVWQYTAPGFFPSLRKYNEARPVCSVGGWP